MRRCSWLIVAVCLLCLSACEHDDGPTLSPAESALLGHWVCVSVTFLPGGETVPVSQSHFQDELFFYSDLTYENRASSPSEGIHVYQGTWQVEGSQLYFNETSTFWFSQSGNGMVINLGVFPDGSGEILENFVRQ